MFLFLSGDETQVTAYCLDSFPISLPQNHIIVPLALLESGFFSQIPLFSVALKCKFFSTSIIVYCNYFVLKGLNPICTKTTLLSAGYNVRLYPVFTGFFQTSFTWFNLKQL